MADPTAWARVRLPETFQPGEGILKASALGQQAAMEGLKLQQGRKAMDTAGKVDMLRQKVLQAHKAGNRPEMMYALSQMGALDPESAAKTKAIFADLDRTSAVNSAMNLYAAATFDNVDDPEVLKAQNNSLEKSLEILRAGVNPDSPLLVALNDIQMMPPGKERNQALLNAVQIANMMGLYPEEYREGTMKGAGAGADREYERKLIQQYRTDIDMFGKTYRSSQEAVDRINAIGHLGTMASDLALVYNYMKINDPESVVRESEFRTAVQARNWMTKMKESNVPIPSFVMSALQSIFDQGRLTTTQRGDFIDRSNDLFGAAQQSYDKQVGTILERADIDGISRARVIGIGPYRDWSEREYKRKQGGLGVEPKKVKELKESKTVEAVDKTLAKITSPETGKKIKSLGEKIKTIPETLKQTGEKITQGIDELTRPIDKTPPMTPGTSFELPNLNRPAAPPAPNPYAEGPRRPVSPTQYPPELNWSGVYPKVGPVESTAPQASPPRAPRTPGRTQQDQEGYLRLGPEPYPDPNYTQEGMVRVADPSVTFKMMKEVEKRGIDPQYVGIGPDGNLIIQVEGEGWMPFDLGIHP